MAKTLEATKNLRIPKWSSQVAVRGRKINHRKEHQRGHSIFKHVPRAPEDMLSEIQGQADRVVERGRGGGGQETERLKQDLGGPC